MSYSKYWSKIHNYAKVSLVTKICHRYSSASDRTSLACYRSSLLPTTLETFVIPQDYTPWSDTEDCSVGIGKLSTVKLHLITPVIIILIMLHPVTKFWLEYLRNRQIWADGWESLGEEGAHKREADRKMPRKKQQNPQAVKCEYWTFSQIQTFNQASKMCLSFKT